jgi:hypothetical protein
MSCRYEETTGGKGSIFDKAMPGAFFEGMLQSLCGYGYRKTRNIWIVRSRARWQFLISGF